MMTRSIMHRCDSRNAECSCTKDWGGGAPMATVDAIVGLTGGGPWRDLIAEAGIWRSDGCSEDPAFCHRYTPYAAIATAASVRTTRAWRDVRVMKRAWQSLPIRPTRVYMSAIAT